MLLLSAAAAAELEKAPAGATVTYGGDVEVVEEGATWNAVGMLPGADAALSTEVVMLSAHLDHLGERPAGAGGDAIYNGADDDASGCAAVLELARALAAGPRPRRTVYFVCFGSEESGGLGSKYFVDNAPMPVSQIVANLNFEMLGRPDPAVESGQLWLTGFDRSNLGPSLVRRGAKLVADPHPEEGFFQRSDNYTLALRGVVAQSVSSFGLHEDYHQPGDEISKIDFGHMARAIGSILGPVRWLVRTRFRPVWDPGEAPKSGE
jgi:Zn-dependent M28 family amino/carboxypeptidase